MKKPSKKAQKDQLRQNIVEVSIAMAVIEGSAKKAAKALKNELHVWMGDDVEKQDAQKVVEAVENLRRLVGDATFLEELKETFEYDLERLP